MFNIKNKRQFHEINAGIRGEQYKLSNGKTIVISSGRKPAPPPPPHYKRSPAIYNEKSKTVVTMNTENVIYKCNCNCDCKNKLKQPAPESISDLITNSQCFTTLPQKRVIIISSDLKSQQCNESATKLNKMFFNCDRKLLSGETATKQCVIDTILDFMKKSVNGDTIDLFYIGHGGSNQDEQYISLTNESLLRSEMESLIKEYLPIGVKLRMIIDSYNSGEFVRVANCGGKNIICMTGIIGDKLSFGELCEFFINSEIYGLKWNDIVAKLAGLGKKVIIDTKDNFDM
jgi:hypothetical protein